MNAIRSGHTLITAFALSACLLAGAAHAYTPEQQQACTGDAFRLCGSEIPNIDRITACMMRSRSLLAPVAGYFSGPVSRRRAARCARTGRCAWRRQSRVIALP
jgi:hypothetical protein